MNTNSNPERAELLLGLLRARVGEKMPISSRQRELIVEAVAQVAAGMHFDALPEYLVKAACGGHKPDPAEFPQLATLVGILADIAQGLDENGEELPTRTPRTGQRLAGQFEPLPIKPKTRRR
jgi:hypothetical protein